MNLRGLILTAIDLRRRMELPERPEAGIHGSSIVDPGRGRAGEPARRQDRRRGRGRAGGLRAGTRRRPPAAARDLIVGAYKLDGVLLLELDTKRVIADPAAAAV